MSSVGKLTEAARLRAGEGKIIGFRRGLSGTAAIPRAFIRHLDPPDVVSFVQDQQKTWRPILEQVQKELAK